MCEMTSYVSASPPSPGGADYVCDILTASIAVTLTLL